MTDALSRLQELVEVVTPTVEFYLKREIESPANHQEFAREAQEKLDRWRELEALLPALEQRERELLEQAAQIADNQHKITSVLPGHCNCPRVIAERIRELRAALNYRKCPICGGIEGCDHSVLERERAALNPTPAMLETDPQKSAEAVKKMQAFYANQPPQLTLQEVLDVVDETYRRNMSGENWKSRVRNSLIAKLGELHT